MAKLHFRYGTVSSGKTLDLLKIVFNYSENGMDTLILTSSIDTRYGNNIVKSRLGSHKYAIGINLNDDVYNIVKDKLDVVDNNIRCILVDEVQFLTKDHIFQLAKIADKLNIPVICYGLRSSFDLETFESTQYLMAIADEIEEMKTICFKCGKRKASISAKFKDGIIQTDGQQIEIGGNELYRPMCRICHSELVSERDSNNLK